MDQTFRLKAIASQDSHRQRNFVAIFTILNSSRNDKKKKIKTKKTIK